MPPHVAAAVFAAAIAGLLWLDRDLKTRSSRALWLPVVWLLIAGSRNMSQWTPGTTSGGYSADASHYLEGNPFDRWIFSALVAAGIAVLFSRGNRVTRILGKNAPVILYFLYCAASIAWSDFPDVAFKRWTKAIGDIVMVLVILTDVDPIASVKRVLARIGFVLLPASLLLIKYFPDLGRTYDPGFGVWMPMYTGVTTNKNELGMITMVCGLGALWRVLGEFRFGDKKQRLRHLAAQGTLLAIAGWLLWLAHSTTSTACFAIGTILILATSMPVVNRRPVLVHLIVFGLVFASVFALFLDSGGSLVGSLGKDPTLTGRTDIWNLVLSLKGNPIFGTGFESFWLGPRLEKMWEVYWWHPIEAHNGYLEVFLNLGWLGIILFGMLILSGYRNAFAAFRRKPQTNGIRIAFLVIAVIYNLTESSVRVLNPVWIFFLLSVVAIPEAVRLKARVKKARVRDSLEVPAAAAPSWERA
jgi:exopolysaccharide production protein ExoQ